MERRGTAISTLYISPTGAGDKSGSDWANAATIFSLDAMIQKAGPGGTVLLKADAGAYNLGTKTLNMTHGGADGSPVTIKGVDSAGHDMAAEIIGTRALDATALTQPGGQAFVMNAGANNLVFSNFDIKNVQNAFRASADVSNIEIGNIQATNVQRFFDDRPANDDPLKTATISGLNIHDVNITGYSKGAIRLQFDTHDVKITNVTADSAGQNFDYFAIGVHMGGTVHDVVLDGVTMLNNQNFSGTYWNGDGFASEYGTHHITFIDTVSKGNTDGGYDLKSDYTTLIRATAEDNSRNFRFWGTHNTMTDSAGLDPHNRSGGVASQVWIHGGADISIVHSEFIDSGSKTKVFNFDDNATINLQDVDVTYAADAILKFGSGILSGLETGDVLAVPSSGLFSIGHIATVTIEPIAVLLPAPEPEPVVAPINLITAGPANEVLKGTDKADTFFFDTASGVSFGTDTIKGFAADDRLVTTTAIFDSNNDGKIGANASDRFSLPAELGDSLPSGSVKIYSPADKLITTIKLLDTVVEDGVTHYVYGTPAPTTTTTTSTTTTVDPTIGQVYTAAGEIKPLGAIQSTAANDVMKGTAAKDLFFFDTAQGSSLGSDAIKSFGAGDRIVTTSPFYDSNHDGKIGFGSSDRVNLPGAIGGDPTQTTGTLKVYNMSGKAVSVIDLVDTVVDHGVTFYVYSAHGDTTAGADLLF